MFAPPPPPPPRIVSVHCISVSKEGSRESKGKIFLGIYISHKFWHQAGGLTVSRLSAWLEDLRKSCGRRRKKKWRQTKVDSFLPHSKTAT